MSNLYGTTRYGNYARNIKGWEDTDQESRYLAPV